MEDSLAEEELPLLETPVEWSSFPGLGIAQVKDMPEDEEQMGIYQTQRRL